MPFKRQPRRIAPRLSSGDCRLPFGHGLPESIKAGLRDIAREENCSMSWVLEQLIVDWLGARADIEPPEYKPKKEPEPPTAQEVQKKKKRKHLKKAADLFLEEANAKVKVG